jgi:hypothetical protein
MKFDFRVRFTPKCRIQGLTTAFASKVEGASQTGQCITPGEEFVIIYIQLSQYEIIAGLIKDSALEVIIFAAEE